MGKKFKIVIPDKIDAKDAHIVSILQKEEITEVELRVANDDGIFHSSYYIPWYLLQEVKEEHPKTFDEYMEEKHGKNWRTYSYGWQTIKRLHEWTIENEKLKHAPECNYNEISKLGKKETLEEYLDRSSSGWGCIANAQIDAWKACERSWGLR
jgi:hypothetical protein